MIGAGRDDRPAHGSRFGAEIIDTPVVADVAVMAVDLTSIAHGVGGNRARRNFTRFAHRRQRHHRAREQEREDERGCGKYFHGGLQAIPSWEVHAKGAVTRVTRDSIGAAAAALGEASPGWSQLLFELGPNRAFAQRRLATGNARVYWGNRPPRAGTSAVRPCQARGLGVASVPCA